MPLQVLAWEPSATDLYPLPRLKDDSEHYTPAVVKELREWLQASLPEEMRKPPTPILLNLQKDAEAPVSFKGVPWKRIGPLMFQHGQFEILLRDKKSKAVLVKFTYVGARSPEGYVVCGPLIKKEVVGIL